MKIIHMNLCIKSSQCDINLQTIKCTACYGSFTLLEMDSGTNSDTDSYPLHKEGIGIGVLICAMWTCSVQYNVVIRIGIRIRVRTRVRLQQCKQTIKLKRFKNGKSAYLRECTDDKSVIVLSSAFCHIYHRRILGPFRHQHESPHVPDKEETWYMCLLYLST